MDDRRSFLAALLPLALLPTAAVAGEPPRVGEQAPPFTARDSDGRTVTLAAFAGRPVVLEWTNPECPYVAKHYTSGNMQALQADAKAKGVVWLTVSSAGPGKMGYLEDLEAAALLDARKSRPEHFLLDHGGELLERYGVPVALTMAVIAPDGRLAYWGAIDDRPTSKVEDVAGARNFVKAALQAIARGEQPSPSRTRPYGCVPG